MSIKSESPPDLPKSLDISLILTDRGTQTRAELNQEVIDEYAEAMRAGTEFPPVTVFYDKDNNCYLLADGFHRVAAAIKANCQSIAVDIWQGDRRDALLHSAGANSKHGLRRSNADKRTAVLVVLQDTEWSQLSNRRIAQLCSVDEKMVRNIKREKGADGSQSSLEPAKQGGGDEEKVQLSAGEEKLVGSNLQNTGADSPHLYSLEQINQSLGESDKNGANNISKNGKQNSTGNLDHGANSADKAASNTEEDKLPDKETKDLAHFQESNCSHDMAPAADSGDYPPKDQAEIEIQSLLSIGHLICITDSGQQGPKVLGEVVEVKEATATDIEMVIRISLQS